MFWIFSITWCRPVFPAPRRVPPWRTGNFHLSGQMKVTKAKALNTSHFYSGIGRQPAWRAGFEGAPTHRPQHAGAGCADLAGRRSAPAGCPFPCLKPCMPRCSWPDATGKVAGVRAHCFGDFHSGQRMKVIRPPGRIPGRPSRESKQTGNRQVCGPGNENHSINHRIARDAGETSAP